MSASGPRAPCGRYAPSPTGPLHLGNLRTALLAWMQARLAGGRFILRMEDLDRPRTRPGCAETILEDMRWLGLDWDEGPDRGGPAGPYTQSRRSACYRRALETLRRRGALFPCYCSRKDIAQAASAPHGAPAGGVYPGTCRRRGNAAPGAVAGLRPPAWRYRAPERTVAFQDAVMGPQAQALAREAGDFVVRRADGLYAYQLAVVVDDAGMGVTDVLRGADLLDSAPRQIELYRALGYRPPRFWHVPLLCDDRGRRLAKRDAGQSLRALRARGMDAAAVVGCLAATLGWAASGAALTARQLLERFDAGSFEAALRAAAKPTVT